jgi:hypothetical protein
MGATPAGRVKKVEEGPKRARRPKNGVSNVGGVFRGGGFGSLVSGF